jgi:hypothetical protein
MPCSHVKLPGGGHAIVCTRGGRQKSCVTCGKPASILCDYPVTRDGKDTTCDRPCCRQHAESVGSDKDYCLAHAQMGLEDK